MQSYTGIAGSDDKFECFDNKATEARKQENLTKSEKGGNPYNP